MLITMKPLYKFQIKFRVCLIFAFTIKIFAESLVQPIFYAAGGYRPGNNEELTEYIVMISASDASERYGKGFRCAGIVLTSDIILSSAKCLEYIKESPLEVISGPYLWQSTNSTQKRQAVKIALHPEYGGAIRQTNNLGLVFLDKSFDQTAMPIPGILKRAPRPSTKCSLFGWGEVFAYGPYSNATLFVDLYIWENWRCENEARGQLEWRPGQFCAGDYYHAERSGCSGDEGGPLFCGGLVAGIMTFSNCSILKQASIFTDLWYYRHWIKNEVCNYSSNVLDV